MAEGKLDANTFANYSVLVIRFSGNYIKIIIKLANAERRTETAHKGRARARWKGKLSKFKLGAYAGENFIFAQ